MPAIGSTGGAFGYGRPSQPASGPVIVGPTPFLYLDGTYSQVTNVPPTSKYMSNYIGSNAAYFYQFVNNTPISGGAIQFTATATNYGYNNISLATVAGSNGWRETKEIWLRLPNTTAGSNGCILVEQGSQTPDGGWYDSQIEMVSGALKCGVWNGSIAQFTLSASVSRNVWHQVVWRYNGTTLDGFYDGVKVTGITSGRQNPATTGNPLFYHLGTGTATNMGSGAYLTGDIAIYKYWNSNLTDAEITSNWNATKGRFGL
jgi:Concanavalin A-like lectin/glucanases superfamily